MGLSLAVKEKYAFFSDVGSAGQLTYIYIYMNFILLRQYVARNLVTFSLNNINSHC